MPNLSIEKIEIADDSTQLATNCHLDLVTSTRVASMPAEFSLPGDTGTLTNSSLRPTGERIDVKVAYGGTPLHTAFSGTIEHIDDLTDDNRYTYGCDLSNLPQGYPQRNQVSNIYNQVTPLNGYTDTSAYTILEDICRRAGLYLGRVDMPDYNLWGNFEVIRKTPVDVAKELCEPFNKFDFLKYVVRCDQNGLQIIAYDYTQGAQVANAHQFTKVKSKRRSFSIYNPEHRIGPSDVLITGGDVYGNNGAYTATGYCSKVFHDSSLDVTTWAADTSNPGNGPSVNNLADWTETDTTIIFLIDMTVNSPGDPRIVHGTILFSDNLDENIAELQSGAVDDIKVRETYVMKQEVRTYNSITGLTEKSTTSYTYDMFTFNNGVFHSSGSSVGMGAYQCIQGVPGFDVSSIKVTYTQTLDVLYANGVEVPNTLSKTLYRYNPTGALQYKNTYTYYHSRDAWILQNIKEDPGSAQEATTALIQFFDNIRNIIQPDAIHGAKTEIGKFQLRNGVQVPPVQLQRDPCPLSQEGERLKEFAINNAFTMSGPYMDYNGLNLLWQLAQREKQLEQQNAYWENIVLTCPIDTSAIVGESVILDGSGGIVDKVNTVIDADEAVTTVVVKRIVYSRAGIDTPISLAGTYPLSPYSPTSTRQTINGNISVAFPDGSVDSVDYPTVQTYFGTSPLAFQG